MTETIVRLPRPFHRTAPSRRRAGYVSMGDDNAGTDREHLLAKDTNVAVRTLACGELNVTTKSVETIHASSVKKLASGTMDNNNNNNNNNKYNTRQHRPAQVIVNISKAAMNSSLALTSREPTYCVMSDSSTASPDSYVLGLKSFSMSEADDSNHGQHSASLSVPQQQQLQDPENNGFPPLLNAHPSNNTDDGFLKSARETIRTARETVTMTTRKAMPASLLSSRTEEKPPVRHIHLTPEGVHTSRSEDDVERRTSRYNTGPVSPLRATDGAEHGGRRSTPEQVQGHEVEDEAMALPSVTFKRVKKMADATKQAMQERVFWTTQVKSRTEAYGTVHPNTAEAFYNLGNAFMRCLDYTEALRAFKSSCRIWRFLKGSNHLAVAKSLDSVAIAALRGPKTDANLREAKKAATQAFEIRHDHLGPWHVDTVESYNKVASVRLHLRQYDQACKAYEEVYLVRKAIFGANHPSVAIAAHSLANCHLKLSQTEQCFTYYNIALEIYTKMNLKRHHPTVARLLRDRQRLDDCLMALVNA